MKAVEELQTSFALDPIAEIDILQSIERTASTNKAEMVEPTGADALFAGVCASFPSPHFVTLREVRDATGHDAERAADALALGIYRSRGRELWGFEFKTSRADWLCELRKPEKAESWFRFCDHWALVVADPSTVKKEELPPGWGLATVHKGRLKWIVKAATLEPEALSRHALAALVYRTQQQERRDEKAAFQQGRAEAKAECANELQEKDKHIELLRKIIDDFEKSSGISLRQNLSLEKERGSEVGRAVKFLLSRHPRRDDIQQDLRQCAASMEREAQALRERAEALNQVTYMADRGELPYWTNSLDLITVAEAEAHNNNSIETT